ncbi:MAG: glycosyltransferase family 9 protein [bacterium]
MKVSTMRLVDRWLGIPVCLVLTLHRKLMNVVRRKSVDKTERILFVKLAEQGATVLAYPALRRAVQMVGRENVYFMVFQENRFILDVMALIPEENVIAINTRGLVNFILGTFRAIARARQLKIDSAIDFEFFARSSAILTYLSCRGKRVGYHSYAGEASYRGDLMTHRLIFNPHMHTSKSFLMMVEALNVPAEKLPAFDMRVPELPTGHAEFHPQTSEVEEVRATLHREMNGNGAVPVILLNANASDLLPLRRWSNERYIELARRLLDKYPDLYIAFTGAPEEAPAVAPIVQSIGSPRCFSMAGKTTLRQLLILYSLAELLVTNDSGPAHFATLTPIDVVVLFGPETPALFAALTSRTHVLWSGTVCSPCVSAYNDRRSLCQDNVCMKNITVDQVFDTVCRVFEARRAK